MRDIDIAVVDGLKVLDPKRPIKEGDILHGLLKPNGNHCWPLT